MSQVSLPLLNPQSPPATRAGCADIARPCNRYTCRMHLWPDTERRGRQHHGVAPAAVLRKGTESCALDLIEANPDGISLIKMAELVPAATYERLRQVEQRAQRRVAAALEIVEAVEAIREVMEGAEIELTAPPNNDTQTIVMHALVTPTRAALPLSLLLMARLKSCQTRCIGGTVFVYVSV